MPRASNFAAIADHREMAEASLIPGVHEDVRLQRPGYSKDDRKVSGGPALYVPGLFYTTAAGHQIKFETASLFTWTTKMSCASFSLPAGPISLGGTCRGCVPGEIKKDGSYTDYHPLLEQMPTGEKIICSVCYAGKNFYLMYPSVAVSSLVHLEWARKTVASGRFVPEMTKALKYMLQPEIEEVLNQNLTTSKFFRIHDAGDVWSLEYYQAWVEVADAVQEIKFWMPTRMWVFQEYLEEFRKPKPTNFFVRPSALYTGAPPPDIDGMAAGSCSFQGDPSPGILDCRAFKQEDDKNCAAVRCRACWDAETPVSYMTH